MTETTEQFFVLRNDEEQCSLWLASLDVPAGWSVVFGPTDKAACTAWVDQNWTDMRPLSLRRRMENTAG